ncbi:MAG: vitamin B12-dependent ribonucleotide reductase [Dehalococcoidia bacterium]
MVATDPIFEQRNGHHAPLELSHNAAVVLERRYLAKDEHGTVVETPEGLFHRVASHLAQAERRYVADAEQAAAVEDDFYRLMTRLDFLPNSPTLGNAGRPLGQLSACFVLPVPDSLEGIFETIKHAALVHQTGGGTGFAFSRLRPEGSIVRSSSGVASGPVSFMKVFDGATEAIKQGGTRRGANMGILAVDHPDIDTFVAMKADMTTLQNFNISVAVTEAFMRAVEDGADYDLINPQTGEVVGKKNARALWDVLVANAWKNGDPGLIFIDRMNATRSNPVPALGPIESTNPCGEQPLYSYDSCNLGSINLAKFVTASRGRPAVDWGRLGEMIPLCVRFLDNVIDMNKYPLPQIEDVSRRIRRVGLGVMGWADLLYELRIPYDSEEALELAERVMNFIQERADAASMALAQERGVFPAWEESIYGPRAAGPNSGMRLRNATRTTIAPTGTLSIIANCSGGIEPVFSLAFMRQHYLDPKNPTTPTKLTEVNEAFGAVARAEGFYSEELMTFLAEGGHLADRPEVPEWVKRVYVTAHDIAPEWHVRTQAAFQRFTDNAVSKTINFPNSATVDEVERAYLLAYREGCKGITIYRDGSRELQVLSHQKPATVEEPAAVANQPALALPQRRRLADERQSITHKFQVGEQEGYITVGLYDDGQPGEVFLRVSKQGSTVSGLMESLGQLTSIALQYGVPLEGLSSKMKNSRFEPSGMTTNRVIPTATSLVDYLFRWLERRFVYGEASNGGGAAPYPNGAAGNGHANGKGEANANGGPYAYLAVARDESGVGCPECGSLLHYAEGCMTCPSCFYTKCG